MQNDRKLYSKFPLQFRHQFNERVFILNFATIFTHRYNILAAIAFPHWDPLA